MVRFRNKVVSVYLAHMIFNFIPAKVGKVRQRLVLMRKKVMKGLCHVCVKPGSGARVLNLGIQKLCTKILGCLPCPHST